MKRKQLLLMLAFFCSTTVFAGNGKGDQPLNDQASSKPKKAVNDTNVDLAAEATAYRWGAITDETSDAGPSSDGMNGQKIEDARLIDGDEVTDVRLNGGSDSFARQAAGVLFTVDKAGINSISFIQGDIVSASNSNGCFTSGMSSEYTTDGVTWIKTNWELNPAYPYDNSMAGEVFTFSGDALPLVKGIRISGMVFKDQAGETSMISWEASVTEIMVTTATSAPVESVNIAANGTAYRWGALDDKTSDTGPMGDGMNGIKIEDARLTDGDEVTDVRLNGGADSFRRQAAGVLFADLVPGIDSISFIQGDIVSASNSNGCFTADMSSEYTIDGTTWIPTGWSIDPAYPYDNSAAGEVFTFSGAPIPAAKGIRISGMVFKDQAGETSMISWEASVTEVMIFAPSVTPISLASFTGTASASGNKLAWTTKSEKNNQKFEILSSSNGKDFSVIGTVASKAVAGNSSSELTYSFSDANASDAYYILKQVDFDGASTSSNVIFVKNGFASAEADVYPNPASDYVNVSLSAKQAGKITISLVSTNGQKVYTESRSVASGKSTFRINLSGKNAGIYLLNITNDKGEIVLRKSISKR